MNTIKYLTIIILAFLFVQCCEKNIQGNEKRITIDLEERTETSVFDLTDSITVVPLHTSDSCLIATINQIEKKKDTLYIYDMQQSAFFCFRTNGSYLFRISDKGNGPEEYQHIEHFSVSETGEIFLLEPWGNIYQYSNKGVFKQKIKLPHVLESYNEIYVRGNSIIIISVSGGILYYSLSDGTYQCFHLYERMNAFFPIKRTSIYNDSIMNVSLFDNQIYKITQEGLIPSWSWDFKDNNNSEQNIEKLTSRITYTPNDKSVLTDYMGKGKPLKQFIYTSCESNRFKIALMEYNNSFLHVFYDKMKHKNWVFKRTKENTIFHTCTYTDNTFIYYDQPFTRGWRNLTCITEEILGDKYNVYTNLKNDSDSNPTVILFHLKE